MDSILASDNLGEVEVGSADCAGGNCLETFCESLRTLTSQRDTHDFLVFSGYNRVWTVQVCMAFQVAYFLCCKP